MAVVIFVWVVVRAVAVVFTKVVAVVFTREVAVVQKVIVVKVTLGWWLSFLLIWKIGCWLSSREFCGVVAVVFAREVDV